MKSLEKLYFQHQSALDYFKEEKMDVPGKVKEILAYQACIKVDEVNETDKLESDLNMDSLDMVEATMEIEEEFDIEISDAESESVKTVQDAIELVEKKVSEKE